jgi:predicted  nucleic acid-binding Zn-ribbon protein
MRAASAALSKQRQASSAKMDVTKAEDAMAALEQEKKELEQELQQEVAAIRERWDQALGELEEVPVTPRKSDIQVELLALAWAPHWQITYQDRQGASRSQVVPAY